MKQVDTFSIKTTRTSNLELFRIITMLMIVAHHYVVNSGLTQLIYADLSSGKSMFLLLFGAWGKTGINCFVLITGYFMCKSKITFKKFCKLLLEIEFYKIIIYFSFCVTGYIDFSLADFIKNILPMIHVSNNFFGCYLIFYLCIPFLNILLHSMNERQHIYLLILCSYVYIFLGTMRYCSVVMNYVSWFIVLYFIASYIRLYPKKIFGNAKFWLGGGNSFYRISDS